MKLSKWTYKIIVIGILLVVGLSAWWFVATKDARAKNASYEQLIRIANCQNVEIAVIQQALELQRLKAGIRRAQASRVNVEIPPVSDPTDIGVEYGK